MHFVFSLTHVLLHTIPTSNLVFILTFVPLPSYRFWKPFVWTLIICKNIIGPKYIGVIIQIWNRSLLKHLFSHNHIRFSPSLTFCFTLFQIAILCLFYFRPHIHLQILKNPEYGLLEFVKISVEQSILESWIGKGFHKAIYLSFEGRSCSLDRVQVIDIHLVYQVALCS